MNRCNVQFVCTGSKGFCDFYKDIIIKPTRYHNGCEHFANGYCTNKEAQIQSLQDEGFEMFDTADKETINDLIRLSDGGYSGNKSVWKTRIINLLKKARTE